MNQIELTQLGGKLSLDAHCVLAAKDASNGPVVVVLSRGEGAAESGPVSVATVLGASEDLDSWGWSIRYSGDLVDLWRIEGQIYVVGDGTVRALDTATGDLGRPIMACSEGMQLRLLGGRLLSEEPRGFSVGKPTRCWRAGSQISLLEEVRVVSGFVPSGAALGLIGWDDPVGAAVVIADVAGLPVLRLPDHFARSFVQLDRNTALLTTHDPTVGIVATSLDESGAVRWQTTIDHLYHGGAPAPYSGRIALGPGRALVWSANGNLCEIDLHDGRVRWEAAIETPGPAGYVGDRRLVLGSPYRIELFDQEGQVEAHLAADYGGLFLHGVVDELALVPLKSADARGGHSLLRIAER